MRLNEFKRSGHWPTLLCAFLYFDMSFMAWTLMGALGVYIAQDFHLTPGQKGLLVAIPLLGGSILRIVLGVATDRCGPRKVGLSGLTLTIIPLLWGWLHSISIGDLAGIGLMLGVAGASFAVALPLASRWYPARFQGLALGIAGAGNSGTVAAALLAPRLAEHFGWRAVFALTAIPVAITLVVFWRLARESPNRPPVRPLRCYLDLLRQSDLWCFAGFYMVTFGGFVGLFRAANPIIDRSGHELCNPFERKIAVFLDQVDQALLAEFTKIIFRLGDAVTVGEENFARVKLD